MSLDLFLQYKDNHGFSLPLINSVQAIVDSNESQFTLIHSKNGIQAIITNRYHKPADIIIHKHSLGTLLPPLQLFS
jgi:hypothetical protein